MNVLVTGGAGFIGSHLVEELITLGYTVYVIDNLSTGKKENIHQAAYFYQYDIQSEEAVNIIEQIQPEYIFHLAAQTNVNQSMKNCMHDAQSNIIGTLQLLEACKKIHVKKFIFASTSAVYGNKDAELLYEEMNKNPISFYGISKSAAEDYIQQFDALNHLNYTILRFSNVYGPRQSYENEGGVVSIFINKLKNNLPITIYGDGTQTRDFIYVKDLVKALIASITNGHREIFHVSTGEKVSINDLIAILEKIHDCDFKKVYTTKRTGDIANSCLCNNKAIKLLNWKPKFLLAHGLLETYMNSEKIIDEVS